LNPGRRGGKPATNRLSYDAAYLWNESLEFYGYASLLRPVPLPVFSFADNIFKISYILLCLCFFGDAMLCCPVKIFESIFVLLPIFQHPSFKLPKSI
jgi:hypothetical protein